MPNIRNKPASYIYPQAVEDTEAGNCPICKAVIHPNKEFRDELSRREYEICGLCQKCQDLMEQGEE